MSDVAHVPSAIHRGADELPWVDAGGVLLRVTHASVSQGFVVIQNHLSKDHTAQIHRHTGHVWGFTESGAWEYLENDFVNRAGSFLYEPPGSVHTLHSLEDDTRAWFQIFGEILTLDPDGNVESAMNAEKMLAAYRALCEAQGFPDPDVVLD